MPAKPSLSALAAEWNNLLLYYSCLVTAEMNHRKQMHIKYMQHYALCENRSYSLFDMKESRFVAHFSAYEHRLANPMIRMNDPDNWKNLYRHCNKKDMYHYMESVILYFETLMSLSLEQRHKLVMYTLHWLENKNKQHDLYLIRVKVIEVDDLGIPWLIMVQSELLYGFKPKEFYPNRQLLLVNEYSNRVEKRFLNGNKPKLRETQLELLILLNKNLNLGSLPDILKIKLSGLKSRFTRLFPKLNSSNQYQAIIMANYLRLLD